MATVKQISQAGTLESSDILIQLSPAEPGTGIKLALESPVRKQFGTRILQIISAELQRAGINDVLVSANDRGALDYTIEARIQAAIARASGGEDSRS